MPSYRYASKKYIKLQLRDYRRTTAAMRVKGIVNPTILQIVVNGDLLGFGIRIPGLDGVGHDVVHQSPAWTKEAWDFAKKIPVVWVRSEEKYPKEIKRIIRPDDPIPVDTSFEFTSTGKLLVSHTQHHGTPIEFSTGSWCHYQDAEMHSCNWNFPEMRAVRSLPYWTEDNSI